MYKQPIIFFGLILPLLAAVGLMALVLYGKSEVETSFAQKKQLYAGSEMTAKAAMGMEKLIAEKRPHMERWKNDMAQQPSSEVTKQFNSIAANLPSKELQQTAFDTPTSATGFGNVTAQKSSQLRIAFRGTFRTMQRAFLELETRMPQLQLQDLKIEPNQIQPSLLNYQVTYTAWETTEN